MVRDERYISRAYGVNTIGLLVPRWDDCYLALVCSWREENGLRDCPLLVWDDTAVDDPEYGRKPSADWN